MNIFDLFTFKKEGVRVFSKENFATVLNIARSEIITQAKANIPGHDKKEIVDRVVIFKIETFKDNCKNTIIKWILEKIIEVIPTVTQLIYDFLKEKIEEL